MQKQVKQQKKRNKPNQTKKYNKTEHTKQLHNNPIKTLTQTKLKLIETKILIIK
jgi:hypothetical protein